MKKLITIFRLIRYKIDSIISIILSDKYMLIHERNGKKYIDSCNGMLKWFTDEIDDIRKQDIAVYETEQLLKQTTK